MTKIYLASFDKGKRAFSRISAITKLVMQSKLSQMFALQKLSDSNKLTYQRNTRETIQKRQLFNRLTQASETNLGLFFSKLKNYELVETKIKANALSKLKTNLMSLKGLAFDIFLNHSKASKNFSDRKNLIKKKILNGFCNTNGLRVERAFGILRLNFVKELGKNERADNVKRKFGIEVLKLCLNNVELAFYY
jgi:hypothetical protein